MEAASSLLTLQLLCNASLVLTGSYDSDRGAEEERALPQGSAAAASQGLFHPDD